MKTALGLPYSMILRDKYRMVAGTQIICPIATVDLLSRYTYSLLLHRWLLTNNFLFFFFIFYFIFISECGEWRGGLFLCLRLGAWRFFDDLWWVRQTNLILKHACDLLFLQGHTLRHSAGHLFRVQHTTTCGVSCLLYFPPVHKRRQRRGAGLHYNLSCRFVRNTIWKKNYN